MDYNLERKIRFNKEGKYTSDYSWSLQEYSKDGEKIGEEQVPWDWSLYFTASELRYFTSIELDDSYLNEDNKEASEGFKDTESILATLHSGYCDDGEWLEDKVDFSMFGTSRNLDNFSLRIYKLDDDGEESCKVTGGVSFTAEIDFRYETQDDFIEIYLMLQPERFDKIAELIKSKTIDITTLRLKGIKGFYSEWSPSIRTDSIKILTDLDVQKVMIDKDSDIAPPCLGKVLEFDLGFTQRCKLNPKQDLRNVNINKLFGEVEVEEEEDLPIDYSDPAPDPNMVLLEQLIRNEQAVSKLRSPLWFIAVLLFLLLLILSF